MNKYSILQDDEKRMYKAFVSQYENFIAQTVDVCNKFKNAYCAENLFEEALKFDKQNIKIVNDIVDECIWLIQKNEPRAERLRFFVALINSSNNLKRITAYLVNFTKFYYKQKDHINDKYRKNIVELFELSIDYLKRLFNIFKNLKNEIDEKAVQEIFDEFLKSYKKNSHELIASIIKLEKKIDSSFISGLVVVVKNFDRYIDNTLYIIDNFADF